MEASESPPIKWTTEKTLTMLGINTKGTRNNIKEYMVTEPKGIEHLNDEDAEGIQAACGGYTKRTLVNGRFVVTRLEKKNSYSSCTGSNTSVDLEKQQRYSTTLMNPHYIRWSRKPMNKNHTEKNKREKDKRWSLITFKSNWSQKYNGKDGKLSFSDICKWLLEPMALHCHM